MPAVTTPLWRRRNARIVWRWVFWGCVAAVLILSLIPVPPELPGTGWDKSNHLVAFGVLVVCGSYSYPYHHRGLLVGLLLFGGLIEVLQSLTAYRLAEWLDWLADAIGIIIGYGPIWLWQRLSCRGRRGGPECEGDSQ